MVLNGTETFPKNEKKYKKYIYINKKLSITGIGLSELKSKVFFIFLWDYYYF